MEAMASSALPSEQEGQSSDSLSSETSGPQDIDQIQANTLRTPDQQNPQQAPQVQPNVKPQVTQTPRVLETQPAEWLSRRLKWWWLAMCFAINIAIIVVIIALIQISARHNGIATVPRPSTNVNSLSISSLWQYGLLWTSLPSLSLALFALMWTSIVAATADRQPFVELRRQPQPANAKVTIMLDYRAYSAFTRWFHAVRNGHIVLGCAMIISIILNLVAVPLASHMIAAVDSQRQRIVPINYLSSFEDSFDLLNYDLQLSIELATAVLVFGGAAPAWMIPEKAFIGFSQAESPSKGNLTAVTTAYSGFLDCQVLNSSNYQNSSDLISIEDRGCTFQKVFNSPDQASSYIDVWYNKCDGEHNRIGLFSGIYSTGSPFNLSSLSVISCIPSYWRETGDLTVLTAPESLPVFQSFFASKPRVEISPQLTTLLELQLPSYAFFEPSGQFVTNAAGFAVYQIAASRDSASPFDSNLVKDSLEQFYNTLYASLMVERFIKSDAEAGNGSATLSVQVTRLYMINAISYVICGFLLVLGIFTLLLFTYTLRHRSMLCEEPVGLFGMEAIAQDSGLSSFLFKFREENPTESKPIDFVKSKYTVAESKCYYQPDRAESSDRRPRTVPRGKIQIDNLVLKK